MVKIIAILFGIGVFIGLMWLMHILIEATDSGGSNVVGIIALICIVIFGAIAVNAWAKFTEKSTEVISNIEKKKKQSEVNIQIGKDVNDYQSYKHSYGLCSNEFLKSNYNNLNENHVENMEMLAIEEEMVKRGFLNYSPMHEKLLAIKKQFNV